MMELLAPAGDFKIAQAVLDAGADAVYVGGQFFNARASATNLSEDELVSLIEYAHIYGKKVYLTVNILLKNTEYSRLYAYLLPYYKAGLDGVIVQDFGVVSFIFRNFPGLPVHASTQMTVGSIDGVRKLQEFGISRAVLPRELSLNDISNIYKATGMELEIFSHGALCFCYSGQCLMSSMIGGRSGNRGQCAQPCRLTYEILDANKRTIKTSGQYVLSPKDLNTINLLPDLMEAGTASLKIEGRMKQIDYAVGVTKIYRQQLDILYSNGIEGYYVSDLTEKKLFDLGNRCGFTDGYPSGKLGKEMITFTEPAHRHVESNGDGIGKISKLPIHCNVKLKAGEPFEIEYSYGDIVVLLKGDEPEIATGRAVTRADIEKQAFKLGNTPFAVVSSEIICDEGLFYSLSSIKQLRQEATGQLLEALIGEKRRNAPNGGEKILDVLKIPENGFEKLVAINVLVHSKEQLEAILSYKQIDGVYVYPSLYKVAKKLVGAKKIFVVIPPMVDETRASTLKNELDKLSEADGYLVSSADGYALVSQYTSSDRIRFDYRMYNYSNETIAFWNKQGIGKYTYPIELNKNEIAHLNMPDAEFVVYSKYPLMVTKQCLHRNSVGCNHKPETWYIRDRKQMDFSVLNHCEYCYNEIYNSVPTVLFGEKPGNASSYRLEFTTENGAEVKLVLDAYFSGDEQRLTSFTRGHFRRGII